MDSNNTLKKCVFKSNQLELEVADKGFVLAGNIGKNLLSKIQNAYDTHHAFLQNPTGVFHTLYSTDLAYRDSLNRALHNLLKPTFDSLFENYKVTANLIIAKFSDRNSAFGIHQDTTGLDETKFTPLNVWIPLQDTAIENGCLCLVPKSQKFAFPYRGTSFAGQFDALTNEITPYLFPIKMRAGDILIFDNRTLHYSPPNTLKKPRVVVMSGIFHKDATILTCFKKDDSSPIELYQQNDDYLLTYKGFKKEPIEADAGIKINELLIANPISDKDDFFELVKQHSLDKHDAFSTPHKSQFYFNKQPIISYLRNKLERFWS
jgi:hypothetical protein